MIRATLKHLVTPLGLLALLLAIWCVGMFGRGYWTPDEPREADIAWRMSWQADRAVPLLAGEAFCEKPPLTYWVAAVPMRLFGAAAWSARLPNLLYALITALGVGLLARGSCGRLAGVAAAAAVSTFLLSYQVAIWLATDAPLLAAESIALLGAYRGWYASDTRTRLRGYLLMHAALGVGFLCKSAAAWMAPCLAILALMVAEKRWRELLRWELYVGLLLQAAMILTWIWFVYAGPDGVAHLKVFFWNNLVGRFTHVDAPNELQYAAAHRNTPGKYLIELPLYLAPWTLLVLAALRQAWRKRNTGSDDYRAVRFALAASLPPLLLLSMAATARNIYFAPALPGVALLLGWWVHELSRHEPDRWDVGALRATALLLLLAVILCAAASGLIAADAWARLNSHALLVAISALGLMLAAWFAMRAWAAARNRLGRALWSLLLAYCALLVGPASQAYRQVNAWQDLPSVARAIGRDATGKPLILFAADETTRAMIDMYARTHVALIEGPIDARALLRLRSAVAAAPQSLVLVQVPGRAAGLVQRLGAKPEDTESVSAWAELAQLRLLRSYSLPNGRRYALLELQPKSAALSGDAPTSEQLMVERVILDDLPRPRKILRHRVLL
ncbi:MAG TPA: glycosyltransferase family 39 protein [Steroidobacteraceae bacterium]|jgi:4-amino-4-deoxy-L-arabinose transferase-like glycosyltransferase